MHECARRKQAVVRTLITMVLACLGTTLATHGADESMSVIPSPVACEPRNGSFVISSSTRVVAAGDAAAEASKLIGLFAPAMGFRLERVEDATAAGTAIGLRIEPSLADRLGDEGYELEVTTRSITLRAAGPAGLFYGVQTLRELLPPAVFCGKRVEGVEWVVPCVRIVDYPRFRWRGLLIDPARHFIPVQDVERFIDLMVLHKFNRLQIHLTDDHGWRIEIRKYPRLAEIGSRMDFTRMQQASDPQRQDASQSSGFYTQDEIRRLVHYAGERHVTIVPEIEMPAHTGAAIVSYPALGLYPEKLDALDPTQRWTANERVLAPRPQTVAFMQDVLAEVIGLFPSRYIHIGGDEANIDHWKQSPEMQAMIRERDLKGEEGLHSWFIGQMDTFLASRGRQLVGWDEILQGGLAPGAVVMSWRGEAGGIAAAQAGHDVIMAPTSHTYFDYYQGPPATEPKAIGGNLPLETVYAYEPIPAVLNADQAGHVLGGQGQLWGEFIASREHRDYMAYPRSVALAEVLWSPRQGRDYAQFLVRLKDHLARLGTLGVNYRPLDK
ncbi:MAG: beta-N-acetylhexosaminidase [Phycisphaerales bacterium]